VIGIVSVIVAIALAIALGWVTRRAWRLRNTALKIVAGIVSGLLTLVLALVSIVGVVGVYRLYTPHGGPVAAVTAAATPVG
jgi:high-affinity nickel permease